MQLQPLVRWLLTALAGGVTAVIAAVQGDGFSTLDIAYVVLAVLAALGITPPQVPTRTVVDPRREDGQGYIGLVVGVLLVLILVVVLLRLV